MVEEEAVIIKRLKKQLVISLLALAIAGGVFWLLQRGEPAKPAAGTSLAVADTTVLWTLGQEEIISIEVAAKDAAYRLLPFWDGFVVEGWETIPQDQSAALELAKFLNLEVWPITPAATADLAEFGLDEGGRVTVTINQTEGEPLRLFVGKSAARGTYVLPEGGDEVLMTTGDRVAVFAGSPTVFISKNLAPYSLDPSIMTLEQVDYTGFDGVSFTVGPTPIDNSTGFSSGFSILSPFVREVAYGKVAEITGGAKILTGEVHQVLPSPEDLAAAGFVPFGQKMKVSFTEEGHDDHGGGFHHYTILLGEKIAGGKQYAMVEDLPVIYTVEGQAVAWRDYSTTALVSLQLLRSPVSDVAGIQIDWAGQNLAIDITGDNDNTLEVTQQGRELPRTDFDLFYELLLRGGGSRFSDKPAGAQICRLSFTFHDPTKPPLLLTFWAGDVYEAVVTTNDPTLGADVVVPMAYVDRLLDCAGRLATGQEIQTILW